MILEGDSLQGVSFDELAEEVPRGHHLVLVANHPRRPEIMSRILSAGYQADQVFPLPRKTLPYLSDPDKFIAAVELAYCAVTGKRKEIEEGLKKKFPNFRL